MKLLLDEMYTPEIAAQLRRRKHDVEAISGSPHTGISDPQVVALAASQRRALLTNNVRDFMVVHGEFLKAGEHHFGLLFTDDGSMPRGTGTIGFYVQSLDEFLTARPADDQLLDGIHWL